MRSKQRSRVRPCSVCQAFTAAVLETLTQELTPQLSSRAESKRLERTRELTCFQEPDGMGVGWDTDLRDTESACVKQTWGLGQAARSWLQPQDSARVGLDGSAEQERRAPLAMKRREAKARPPFSSDQTLLLYTGDALDIPVSKQHFECSRHLTGSTE